MAVQVSRRQFIKASVAGAVGVALGDPSSLLQKAWAQTAQEPIRVGVLTPLTGGGAVYGRSMNEAYLGAANEINQAGGVLGRPIRRFVEDSQTSPDAAVRAARKLVDVNRVHVIMGTWSSAVTLAVAPIAISAGVPLFCTSSSPLISDLDDRDLVYRTVYSQAVMGPLFAISARRLRANTAAVLALNNPYGIALRDSFASYFERLGGKLVGQVTYNPGQASYRSEVQQALAGRPDVILHAGYQPDAVQLVREWVNLGLGGMWMGPGFAFDRAFIEGVGARVAEGMVVIEGVPNQRSTAFRRLREVLRREPDLFAAMAWDQLMVVALAVYAAQGDSSGDAIKRNLRRVANPPGTIVGTWREAVALLKGGREINYEGASGSLDFDAKGDVETDFGIYRIVQGRWQLQEVVPYREVRRVIQQ